MRARSVGPFSRTPGADVTMPDGLPDAAYETRVAVTTQRCPVERRNAVRSGESKRAADRDVFDRGH
jgi:hypothetical protein